jgi:hypothetical protein
MGRIAGLDARRELNPSRPAVLTKLAQPCVLNIATEIMHTAVHPYIHINYYSKW